LDRLEAKARHGNLSVALSTVIPGTKGNAQTAAAPPGGPWDNGPDSFCAGAIKANNALPREVLDVEALANIEYDKQVYEVPAGLIEIRFTGASGSLFTFDDPRYRYCLLSTDRGGDHTCRVYLTPGDYLVYDSVPGHRQAGYEATIHASDSEETSQGQPTTSAQQPTTP
jgi:hypothetical protein